MEPEAATPLPFPQSPEDRLRLALRRLEAALAEQAAAVAGFRAGLASLREATGGLSIQVSRYHEALGETAEKLRHAHGAARALERTAEALAARA